MLKLLNVINSYLYRTKQKKLKEQWDKEFSKVEAQFKSKFKTYYSKFLEDVNTDKSFSEKCDLIYELGIFFLNSIEECQNKLTRTFIHDLPYLQDESIIATGELLSKPTSYLKEISLTSSQSVDDIDFTFREIFAALTVAYIVRGKLNNSAINDFLSEKKIKDAVMSTELFYRVLTHLIKINNCNVGLLVSNLNDLGFELTVQSFSFVLKNKTYPQEFTIATDPGYGFLYLDDSNLVVSSNNTINTLQNLLKETEDPDKQYDLLNKILKKCSNLNPKLNRDAFSVFGIEDKSNIGIVRSLDCNGVYTIDESSFFQLMLDENLVSLH